MFKFYLPILLIVVSQSLYAQCPVINGALINACAADGVTEGINEFVYFTTPAAAAVSSYKFSYGSRNPPSSQNPTGILSGTDASAKTGPGSVLVQPGNTLHQVTSAATVIPAGSSVVFIPNSLDQVYDLTNICKNNEVYVVYINIDAASNIDSKWMAGGTMANAATSLRYLQMEFNGNACTANVRSYDGALWANPGNVPAAEGNSLAWNAQDSTLYVNNGCSVIVTPVSLLAFTATVQGKQVALNWQTATETNSRSFTIQRSSNGRDFSSIATMNAAGNSDMLQSYRLVDAAVTAGTWFYRLIIHNTDGSFTYSPVAKINLDAKKGMQVYVSSINHGLSIVLTDATAGQGNIVIIDQAGRIVQRQSTRLTSGYNRVELNTAALPAGAYVLQLITTGDRQVARFVKP